MRYTILADVHFEEATPRGPLVADLKAGEIEPADDSDERFVIEYRLIPAGLAHRDGETPIEAPAPTPDAVAAPVVEPETPAPPAPVEVVPPVEPVAPVEPVQPAPVTPEPPAPAVDVVTQ